MNLTPTQLSIIKLAFDTIQYSNEVSIAGLAGTGKTTIVKYIIQKFIDLDEKYIVLTPTGKAANVLRNKGVNADTIHSAIYDFKGKFVDEKTGDQYLSFEEKGEVNGTPKYCIVDEASMVNDTLANDLRELGMKIIWVGDNGQLPPVGRDPMIMRHPDFELKEIFRQKGNSGLIDFAHDVRGNVVKGAYDNIDIIQEKNYTNLVNLDFDQAICGFNKTRVLFNRAFRKMKGYKKIIEVGEKMICLQNNRRAGLFNGMQFTVTEVKEFLDMNIAVEIELEGTGIKKDINIRREALGNAKYNTGECMMDEIFADYAYCITCHKSQGSEYNKVLVFNEECSAWDQKRWLYTAATRAKSELIIVSN